MAKQQKIDDIIRMAVEAGRIAAQSEAKDAYKATERRLYALPVLRKKVKNDREKLMEYITYGIPEKSKSITRFMRSGVRLSTTDIAEALKQDLEATIAADEYEVSVVEEALKSIESDQYYMTVTEKYLDNKSDDEVAEKLYCDPSTVRRNRSRLVRKIAIELYGAQAI